ncbi:hypothetical protein M426DRAFT_320647 [Hypoxylon sp. CI-4A]|nr:hypothetical protein M426DRAFT_320647 [Hypoxylon sp. CI-4A]
MSSFGRTFIPIGIAVAFGVWNGYYAFNPALKEQQKGPQQSDLTVSQQLNQPAETKDPSQQEPAKINTPPGR